MRRSPRVSPHGEFIVVLFHLSFRVSPFVLFILVELLPSLLDAKFPYQERQDDDNQDATYDASGNGTCW